MKILKRFLMFLLILLVIGVTTSCDDKSTDKDSDSTQIIPDDDSNQKPGNDDEKPNSDKDDKPNSGEDESKEQAICTICKEPYG